MFDDHHAVAAIDQTVQHFDQSGYVGQVQATVGSSSTYRVCGPCCCTFGDVVAHLAEFGDELDALGFAA